MTDKYKYYRSDTKELDAAVRRAVWFDRFLICMALVPFLSIVGLIITGIYYDR